MTWLLLALAGGLGAWTRFRVDGLVRRHWRGSVPVGTLVINVTGSFLLGLVTGWFLHHGDPYSLKAITGTGFLGGYTTFSTASVEIVNLTRAGQYRAAIFLGVGMVLAGLAAAAAGLALLLIW